jgi:hypothetical protein
MRGAGDLVYNVVKVATAGKLRPCGGCKKRRRDLNRAIPFGGD